jgi:hypothetical protein
MTELGCEAKRKFGRFGQQQGGELTPAIPTTRTGRKLDATVDSVKLKVSREKRGRSRDVQMVGIHGTRGPRDEERRLERRGSGIVRLHS